METVIEGIINIFENVIFIALFFVLPLYLTIKNIKFLITNNQINKKIKYEVVIEWATLIIGLLYTKILFDVLEIQNKDWPEALVNNQKHPPISTKGQVPVLFLVLVGVISYSILKYALRKKLPPLLIVLAISGVYIGLILSCIWIIQVFSFKIFNIYFTLFPINIIILSFKLLKNNILSWQNDNVELIKKETIVKSSCLDKFRYLLLDSKNWLLLGFIFMLPLLGIILACLLLFGQRPDSIIRAWTETSEWNLSQHISPPNVQYDEHYLCTVAASGHRKLVKPQRMGVRHGHRIVVNRQLCIANAFEQILEENIPKVHKFVRKNYDKYGYPVAQKITSPYIADFIYYLMKPAEYLFLIVIYLTDVNPENRIALQYITKRNKEIE